MIDVEPGVDGGEFEPARFTGRRIGRLGTAAGAGHGVKVDVVHHDAVVMIFQADFHGVADAHANEWSWYLLIECPISVGRTVGEIAGDFDGFKIDPDTLGTASADRHR